MNEEEAIKICKNIIRSINGDTCYMDYSKEQDKEAIETLLELYHKKQEEIEELNSEFAINTEIHKRDMRIKELEEVNNCLHETNNEYISKDKVLKALGYEENGEEYKRIYNKEELILSLIRTINEECDRLEDIEDQKTMLEIHNIENQRDKYWQDKIRDKIKALEEYFDDNKENTPTSTNQFIIDSVAISVSISLLKELLEEK